MSHTTETAASRVPAFANEAQAAAFWDSHSPLDYPDEFEEVEVRFVRASVGDDLTIGLDAAEMEQLHRLADERGTRPSDLARAWVVAALRGETIGAAAPS